MSKRKQKAKLNTDALDAINLKNQLWDTLQRVKAGEVTAGSADAVASQAREILRTVKTQLAIFQQAGKAVTNELIGFARPAS